MMMEDAESPVQDLSSRHRSRHTRSTTRTRYRGVGLERAIEVLAGAQFGEDAMEERRLKAHTPRPFLEGG
jgi:hypothetical protein